MARKYSSLDEVPIHIKEKLSRYFSNVGGTTFVIHGLPSELTGGALARYSRAPTGMQLTVVNEFLDENGNPLPEKGSELMDRVLNAFGDDSVGELEGVHTGVEDVSQLMTKHIEDRRIGGSPIEQSTRYVKYDVKNSQGKWRYLRPKDVIESGLREEYEKANDLAFEVYSEGIRRLTDHFKKELPRSKFQIDVDREGKKVKIFEDGLVGQEEVKAFNTAYNFTIRCAALDVGRCVLPSSTLTHLGLYGNGRFFTNLLTHLKIDDLEESRQRASELETELKKYIPTFIKRADESDKKNRENLQRVGERSRTIDSGMRKLVEDYFEKIVPEDKKVTMVKRADYLDEVISASLFPYAKISMQQILSEVQKMSYKTKIKILETYIGNREGRRDRTGRGFEAGYPLTFDLVGGFAEYRDLERHRMLTQQRQLLGVSLGFLMPPEMAIVGLEKEVEEVVSKMEDLNGGLRRAGLDAASQYATLFNHRIRFMLGMNLREFQHLSELRTQLAGHFSYRAMVMEMAREVEKAFPWASKSYGFVNYSDPENKISRYNEQAKIAGKSLKTGVDMSADL